MYAKFFNTGSKTSNSLSLAPYQGTPNKTSEVQFLEPYDRINPTIRVTGRQPAIRYVILSENADYSSPYYYRVVGAPVYDSGQTVINLQLDVLATYRTSILNSTQYVVRATNYTNRNYDIMDDAAPNFGVSYNTQTYATADPFANRVGSYVIQYVGKNGVSVAVMNQQNFSKLSNYLWEDFSNIDGMTDVIIGVFDPLQYVTDIKYYPMSIEQFYAGGNLPTSYDPLTLGTYGINYLHSNDPVIAYPLFSASGDNQPPIPPAIIYDLTIPKHPNSNTTNKKYLCGGKYSVYTMRLPGGDWFTLDSSILVNAVKLQITARVDILDGSCNYEIYGLSSDYGSTTGDGVAADQAGETIWRVASYTCKIGIPWQLAGTAFEMPSIGGTISNVGSNLATGNLIGAVGSLISPIFTAGGNMIDAAMNPNPVVNGGLNGVQSLRRTTTVMLKYSDPGELDAEHIGVPVQENTRLSNCSGFCVCRNAKLNLATFPDVNTQCEQLLNGGVYIE